MRGGRDPRDLEPERPRDRVREELGAQAGDVLALGLGRLAPEKGWEALLEAAAAALGEAPALLFAIAGEGSSRARLEARARWLGIAGRVRFLGYRRDVGELLGAADLFALLPEEEALGLGFVEAALAGLPAVATEVGGIPEVVRPETGILVPARDTARAARALAALARDPALRRRLGEAARERALRLFTLERMVRELDAVYEAALREGGGRRAGSGWRSASSK